MKMSNLVVAMAIGVLLVGCGGGDDGDSGGISSVSGYRCSDFTRQSDAQAVYRLGATQLDSDRDGIACESLP